MQRADLGGRPRWLHNMSVPARSALKCARVTLPGPRFRVSLLPADASAARTEPWLRTMHAYLRRHGIAALAALVDALREGRDLAPVWTEKTASRWKGDPAAYVGHELGKRADTLPPGLGVFVTDLSAGSRSDGATQLDTFGSLAVLARRCGTLYLPARPIEPSLITLDPCVVVFPAGPVAARSAGGESGGVGDVNEREGDR